MTNSFDRVMKLSHETQDREREAMLRCPTTCQRSIREVPLRSWAMESGRVEIHADHLIQSFQG
jgi:hypothetical protein